MFFVLTHIWLFFRLVYFYCIYFVFFFPFAVSVLMKCFFFFVKQKTAYDRRISDWSSDVFSSDLSWLVIEGFPQLRQQLSAAEMAGASAASSGLAIRRSTSLKAWPGMRARFSTVVRGPCGTSGLAACRPPCTLRRLRDSTQPLIARAVITLKRAEERRVGKERVRRCQ